MIRSLNVTALQIAVNPQPQTSATSLVAKIAQPGASVSLNPQPLPPLEVFANVKAALNAPYQLLSATATANHLAPTAFLPVGPAPTLDPNWDAVDKLNQAEHLMEDAYRRFSEPDRTQVEQGRGYEEMKQAEQIRDSVSPGLDYIQQASLGDITKNQISAMFDAMNGVDGQSPAEIAKGKQEFNLGAKENGQLINWIQGIG